jgi:hypothetical protein
MPMTSDRLSVGTSEPSETREASGAKATAPTAATRYLAAAAYMDASFRARVLEIDRAEFRARAPEPGIDTALVTKHCKIARARKAWRDAALCLPLIYFLSSGLVPALLSGSTQPTFLPIILAAYGVVIGSVWMVATAIVFCEAFLTEIVTLTLQFRPKKFCQPQDVRMAPEAIPLNVVVYGGFSPFVGSGYDLAGWSFAVNLEVGGGGRDGEPNQFAICDLYKTLRSGFERLTIDGLVIIDRLYVDGKAIRGDTRFLQNMFARPAGRVDASILEQFRAKPENNVRHYLCLQIEDWSGQVVLSTFVRLQKSASKLFVEVSSFLLPPLKNRYYEIDARSNNRLVSNTVGLIVTSLIQSPFLLVIGFIATVRRAWSPIHVFGERRRKRREIRNSPLYNYGATTSIRELGTENVWRVYFQKLDKEMYSKIVQQQLLDVLAKFLDEHGVDISELKERGSYILNNGVIVSGGSIKTEGLAVGQGAQTKVSKRG